MAIDIGRIAYAAYLESLGATNLSAWENLGKVQQDAWRHVAVEVLQFEQPSGDTTDEPSP